MEQQEKVRILGRQLGREISVKEMNEISGGEQPVSYVDTHIVIVRPDDAVAAHTDVWDTRG